MFTAAFNLFSSVSPEAVVEIVFGLSGVSRSPCHWKAFTIAMSSLLVTQQCFGSFEKKVLAVSTCPLGILVIGRRSNIVSGLQIWSLRSGDELRLRDAERSVNHRRRM